MSKDLYVNIRDFTRFPYKYLKIGSYVVTKNDVPYLKVVVSPIRTSPIVVTKDVVTKKENKENVVTLQEDREGLCAYPGCNFKVYADNHCMKHWKNDKGIYAPWGDGSKIYPNESKIYEEGNTTGNI